MFGIDKNFISYYFKSLLSKKKILTNNINNPCTYLKAIKNKIEIDGAKKANIRDGVSITKFLWGHESIYQTDDFTVIGGEVNELSITFEKSNENEDLINKAIFSNSASSEVSELLKSSSLYWIAARISPFNCASLLIISS